MTMQNKDNGNNTFMTTGCSKRDKEAYFLLCNISGLLSVTNLKTSHGKQEANVHLKRILFKKFHKTCKSNLCDF